MKCGGIEMSKSEDDILEPSYVASYYPNALGQHFYLSHKTAQLRWQAGLASTGTSKALAKHLFCSV